jgi:hypothetical protein
MLNDLFTGQNQYPSKMSQMDGFNWDHMGNILITSMYIPRQYTAHHYTEYPLKSLRHGWYRPHFNEIFNISAYQMHTSLLPTPTQVCSIGTLTYTLWLRFTLLQTLSSGRHCSSGYRFAMDWKVGGSKLGGTNFLFSMPAHTGTETHLATSTVGTVALGE